MTYNPNIPQPTDLLNVSVSQIQQNFLAARNWSAVNHFPMDNLTANIGKHIYVDMPILAAPPTIIAGDGAAYTATLGQSQLCYTADAGGKQYQLTRAIDASFSLFGKNVNNYNAVGAAFTGGWTFLPGGMLFQYGFVTGIPTSGSRQKAVVFPVAFTNNPAFNVQVTGLRNNTGGDGVFVLTGSVTNLGFTIQNGSTTITTCYWTAIGV